MHLVTTAAGTICVDAGLYQGRRDEARQRNREVPWEAIGADALLLTHAHIDHSGNTPGVVKRGFAGPIYSTPATRDLCAVLLRDSARLQEADAEYLNRQFGDEPGWRAIEPLYGEDDAIRALERFVGIPYRRPFPVLPGVTATFLDAGHILGSAMIVLDVEEGDTRRRLVFSGDLGRKGLPILRDPETPPGPVDYLFMESTYGNRVHGSVRELHDDLERVLTETVARGGKLLVPSFAVGRTQELIYVLASLRRQGRLGNIPVFIDSPLSISATEIFRLHPDCFDSETRTFLEQHGDVFDFPGLRYVRSREESMALNSLAGPAIIIAAAGMCEGGRILHHLKNGIEDPRNTILIVGFQAQHTLGRRLVERRARVKVFGVERDLRAHVVTLNGFSAHADRNDLMAYARSCAGGLRRLFLVHGEPEAQTPLATAMRNHEQFRGVEIVIPARGDTAELE